MRCLSLVCLTLCLTLGQGALAQEPEPGPAPGLRALPERPLAADFSLAGPAGEMHRLADYRGQPIILNFWATWCPPCRAEMPSMQRAHETLSGEGAGMVMAINVGEDAEAVRRFLESLPLSFPLPLDVETEVTPRYPVRGLPTTYVIDPEGHLVYEALGEQRWDDPAILDQVRALARP
ncbi:MAG: TlpA family protein disulfide reductase [Chromatiaceae bacterium]|nr:TlpA family protein disulfide reductase [Chromatiaceae bacterium]